MLTEEQKEQRLSYVTGSDAGIICGVSKYSTPYELWTYKTRRATQEDISDKPSVKAGNMLEDAVRNWFEIETGKKVKTDNGFLVHSEYDWMGANIDGYIEEENAIFEAKTASYATGWGQDGDNIIPDTYLCQVAHYCAVKNADKAYVAVLIGGIDFRIYTYERDLKLEQIIIEKEKQFWDHVINDIIPPFVNSQDVLLHYSNKSTQGKIMADRITLNKIEKLKKIRDEISNLEKEKKKLQEDICITMEDKDTLVDSDDKPVVTWKQSNAVNKFNLDLFKEELPEIYSKYIIQQQGSRRFLIKK